MVNSGSSANLLLIQSLLNLGRIKKRRYGRCLCFNMAHKRNAVNSIGFKTYFGRL